MTLNPELRNKLFRYFQKKLGSYDYRRGWLKSDCPSCGEHKFGINLSLNKSNCFKCNYKIRPMDLVMEIEGIQTYFELIKFLSDIEGIQYKEPVIEPYSLRTDAVLPDGYRNIRIGESRLARTARAYLKGRGFNIAELSKAGWGYCTKDKYLGYIIMPFYLNNTLVYFNARRFIGSGPKFNNPDIDDFGIGKSMIIYNVDALYRYDRVFMFEGLMNAATIGDSAIATGGKKVSNYQLNIIIKSPVKRVVIGLDDDAIEDAISLGLQLIDYKQIKIMLFPVGKDVNDLGKRKSLKLVWRSNWLDYKGLMNLKHEHEAT